MQGSQTLRASGRSRPIWIPCYDCEWRVHYKHRSHDCGHATHPMNSWRSVAPWEDWEKRTRNGGTTLVNSLLQLPEGISTLLGTYEWTTIVYFVSVKCHLKMRQVHRDHRRRILGNDPNSLNLLLTLQRELWQLSTQLFLHQQSDSALRASCARLRDRMRRQRVPGSPHVGRHYESDTEDDSVRRLCGTPSPTSTEDSSWLRDYLGCHPRSFLQE
jgi:hypothetical protein